MKEVIETCAVKKRIL